MGEVKVVHQRPRVEGAVAGSSFKAEAQAFAQVADVLEGRPKEEACAIMAGVCACLGFYDEAERFLDLARQYRQAEISAALLASDGAP